MEVAVEQQSRRRSPRRSRTDPDDPSVILAGVSPERLRDFHTGRKILVVDDNVRTAKRIAEKLSKLKYGTVRLETNPIEAISLVREAAALGVPFDAIVLDLYMPEKTGVQVMKELAEILPAVVVNTASMMAPMAADLSVQLDAYRSAHAKSLFDNYRDKNQERALPSVPIFCHHKLAGFASLVDKLDSAMLVREFSKESISDFLASYTPRLIDTEISSEMVHAFCEEVHSLVVELTPIVKHLKAEYRLTETQWYQANGKSFEQALGSLSRVRFTTTLKDTPTNSASRLHDILNNIELVAPPELPQKIEPRRLESNPGFLEHVDSWNAILRLYKEIAGGLRDSFNAHHGPTFDFTDFFSKICPHAHEMYFSNRERGANPMLKDDDRFLRALLQKLVATFDARVKGEDYERWLPTVSPGFVEERDIQKLEVSARKKFEAITCGDSYRITWSDSKEESLESTLTPVLPLLGELNKRKLGVWNVREGERKFFEIYLKVNEKKLDLEKRDEEERKKQADGSHVIVTRYRKIKVFEDLVTNCDLVAISQLPRDLKISRPMLYMYEGKKIIAAGDGHLNSAGLISTYIAHLRGETTDSPAFPREYEAKSIYGLTGVRATVRYGDWTVEVSDGDPNAAWVMEALMGFGIPGENIRFGDLGERAMCS